MHPSTMHRIFWGLILVAVGAGFLLNQTGYLTFDISDLFRSFWPVILILVGVQGLLIQRHGGYGWNAILIVVGVFFLGRNLGWIDWEFGDLIRIMIPVILIIWGLRLLVRGSNNSRRSHSNQDGWNPVTPPSPPEPSDLPPPPEPGAHTRPESHADFQEIPDPHRPFKDEQYWKRHYWKEHHRQPWKSGDGQPRPDGYSRFIGDFVFDQDYFELRPMSISHFIGDTKLDLTRAQIPLGETRIYVSTFIGDVKVFVPDDYSFGIRVISSSLIGDVKVMEQKRGGMFNQVNVETPQFADASRQVVLVVNTFIGDVRVTKVG